MFAHQKKRMDDALRNLDETRQLPVLGDVAVKVLRIAKVQSLVVRFTMLPCPRAQKEPHASFS
jgi:hypothetical protein